MSDINVKSIPPGFIMDACRCIEGHKHTLYDSINLSVEPESLKRLRSGSALDNDIEMVKKYFPEITTPGILHHILSESDTNVWLLTVCWILLRKYSWNNLLLPSLTRCANFNMQITPPLSLRSASYISKSVNMTPAATTATADIVIMQYRTIVQKLNKYHQLDRSRVMIFQDISKILSDIADYFEKTLIESTSIVHTTSTSSTSTSVNNVSTTGGDNDIWKLTHSNMSRLLDNLWTSAVLIDDTTTSTSTKTWQSGKIKSDTKQSFKPEQKGNLEVFGIDTLRTEYDAIRHLYTEAQQYGNSQCSFLRWVGAVASPMQLQVPHSALDSGYLQTHSVHSSDTALPIPPGSPCKTPNIDHTRDPYTTTGSSASSRSSSGRGKKPGDSQCAVAEAGLDTAVLDAVPVLGTLEECMLELIDTQELDWLEVSRISSQIDQNYAEDGLSFEEIDRSFQCFSQYETENSMQESSPVNNLYDILDSECVSNMCANSTENELLQRHLQKQLNIPLVSASKELAELRQLHDHTLHRVARACEKYNPYEIVWNIAV